MEWTIKQVSEQIGIPTDSLRYYDKLGIVSPKRAENGYRYYNQQDIEVLQYVTVMKYAHFSLAEIKEVVGAFGHEFSDECNIRSRKLLTDKVAMLQGIVSNYQHVIQLLEKILVLMENSDEFVKNQDKIDTLISLIFNNIRESTM